MHLLLGNTSDNTILEVDDERDETEPMNPYHYHATMSHSVLETSTRNTKVNSALSINERVQGVDKDLKVKLESVISILSSMKNDFN